MKTQLSAAEIDATIDFMNLDPDKETVPAVIEKAHWYPLERSEISR